MRLRRVRGGETAGTRGVRRCVQGLDRRLPARGRHVPVLFALPVAAAALVSGQDGRDPIAVHDAQEPPPGRPAQAPPRQVHPEAREAIAKIRSPFCPGQMLEVCPSRDAALLRDSLDRMAERGLPADSIVELVVAMHGEEYRALPKRTGTGLLAWVMPPAALIAGCGLVVLALRRLKGAAPTSHDEGLTDAERERLDEALAELEALEDT